MGVFLEFHNNEIINQSTSTTFIVLDARKNQRTQSHISPINLVPGLYKIILRFY